MPSEWALNCAAAFGPSLDWDNGSRVLLESAGLCLVWNDDIAEYGIYTREDAPEGVRCCESVYVDNTYFCQLRDGSSVEEAMAVYMACESLSHRVFRGPADGMGGREAATNGQRV